ncbi:MAG: DNA primase DnaG [Candidatus Nanohalobium sp.]
MGKVAQDQVSYVIEASLEAGGVIEKSDIVGAIFGQTQGLLGEELDLRELKETGKVGRMDVEIQRKDGKTEATIELPTSLDATDTALLGASLETIERVGPTNADLTVERIRDDRTSKRDYIVKRAKQLLDDIEQETPSKAELEDEIKEEVRENQVSDFRGFTAGPDAEREDEVVLVEGKADVVNLLKHGLKNAVAIDGTDVPEGISKIAEDKDITAFLDGDRGGDLILEELKEKAEPRYVARAPEGKEVEELSKQEAHEALRDKRPVKYANSTEVDEEVDEKLRSGILEALEGLVATRAVNVLDEDLKVIEKAPLDRVEEALRKSQGEAFAVVLDGEVDSDLVSMAEEYDVDYVAGMSRSDTASSSDLEILTREKLAAAISSR